MDTVWATCVCYWFVIDSLLIRFWLQFLTLYTVRTGTFIFFLQCQNVFLFFGSVTLPRSKQPLWLLYHTAMIGIRAAIHAIRTLSPSPCLPMGVKVHIQYVWLWLSISSMHNSTSFLFTSCSKKVVLNFKCLHASRRLFAIPRHLFSQQRQASVRPGLRETYRGSIIFILLKTRVPHTL